MSAAHMRGAARFKRLQPIKGLQAIELMKVIVCSRKLSIFLDELSAYLFPPGREEASRAGLCITLQCTIAM